MIEELLNFITNSVIIGVGATAVMDLWALMLQRFLGIVPLNYAIVGRWVGYMSRGVFCHRNIVTVKPVAAELAVGWIVHYLIGIGFAALLLMLAGNEWLSSPRIMPAIIFGIASVTMPFFIMQPCMGFGFAAAKTHKPISARLRSLQTHFIFGLGLYGTAVLMSTVSLE
jgi:hypothetical protein